MKPLLCFCALAMLVSGLLIYWKSSSERQNVPETPNIPPLPALTKSPFLNTQGHAAYVGRPVYAECHTDIDQSFQKTAHAEALAPVMLSNSPEDADFHSPHTKRRYRIFRKDHQLWHQESLRTRSGDDLELSAYPLRWVIGSGRFSKSYLVEEDGFLIQSPITWYQKRPGWDLSPGYAENYAGFERTMELRCVLCHVGRAEPVDGSYHRLKIHTQAIDCERCHGPGSLHAAKRGHGDPVQGDDFTIVHPGRLDREGVEAICAQCHLHGVATVDLRGRDHSDFRPGGLLTDFAVSYGLQTPSKRMEVVGHMEQMRLSRCYQTSESLTCTTCHNPHETPNPEERIGHYRAACLQCHESQGCGMPERERLKDHPGDSCIACHMPESPTEIPHFAFTHHRIGLHDSVKAELESSEPQQLVPLADDLDLSELDQDRNLGLAYVQVADLSEHGQHAGVYHDRARRLLENVRQQGLRDPPVDAALARLYWQRNDPRTIPLSEAVLATPSASPDDRATALFTLATTTFQQGNVSKAATLLEELVTIRRYSDAWHVLSLCRDELGDLDGAVSAAVRASEISPIRPDFQERLIHLYERTNRRDLAKKHRDRLRQLTDFLESP